MYLRQITLAGFKTFANRTEIRFGEGVTAIVGPNGSGKTNIVDGFRWVLGETQARDLRGSKMQEVIYGGGVRRAAASAAEVALVIDNSEGRLPVDYSEVEIKRHLGRDGDSDYFLNGTRVRRRDVIDLLSATGLAVDAYSIITQPDIDFIVTCTAQQRRGLIEEAARIRGIKAKRAEAADRLRQLAQNMVRLEDVRLEIEPRLEVVRAQAAAAKQALEATRRLETLRGSIAWEEWREARDTFRRAQTSLQALQRRVADAREQSSVAEAEFQRGRAALQQAQDRRLQHQRAVGELRLEVAQSEHAVALAHERIRNQEAAVQSLTVEEREISGQLQVAEALSAQIGRSLDEAKMALQAVPDPPRPPDAVDLDAARDLRRSAESKRRAAAGAASNATTLASRREFLQQTVDRLRPQVESAEAALEQARIVAAKADDDARATAAAATQVVALRAELSGLAALEPEPGRLPKLEEVLVPEPGFEAALAAALGPFAEALVAGGEDEAGDALRDADRQTTVLYPRPADAPQPGSLYHHVDFEARYEPLARRFLGAVAVDSLAATCVTVSGRYRHPGLTRAGENVRARLLVRRRELEERLRTLEPGAERSQVAAERARAAHARLAEVETAAAGRRRLEESLAQLAKVVADEQQHLLLLQRLQTEAVDAERRAEAAAHAVEHAQAELVRHQAEVRRLELERSRWQDRAADLERQRGVVETDIQRLRSAREARRARIELSAADSQRAAQELADLDSRRDEFQARLAALESEPDVEQLATSLTRELIALEESRVDARLKLSTLEGNLNLIAREAELAQARMDLLRESMPEGMAPEEVPGGKAREREMRTLEKLLEELGPTNPLAQAEFDELDRRYSTLLEQLDDLREARLDLEQLIVKLQEQEESRYDAVFGAVATHFREYFGELTGGGKATLRNVREEDGAPGLEILVQPPRKRMQSVSLLSSGERALTALALMFALQQVNPSPFVILDEVDAALDDANVDRFGAVLERLGLDRQFLVVTHNHATMARATALYGIHLDESGTSHLVSARLDGLGQVQPQSAAAASA